MKESEAWNKSADLRSHAFTFNDKAEEEAKKKWTKDGLSDVKSSTLSLHISAYENSKEITGLDSFNGHLMGKRIKLTWINNFFNPFEFPRQQEKDQVNKPELMGFRANQKLLAPDQSTSSNTARIPSDQDEHQHLSSVQRRRLQDREEWNAYWKLRKLDAEGGIFPTAKYYVHRFADAPVTWFRQKIVEPLHDKNKMPYYQRRLTRVPEIDQCGVNDQASNEQYRLDKLVDFHILNTLRERSERCVQYHQLNLFKCAEAVEDMEEAELGYFIKYGEMNSETDVRDVYMKQKHRMIWERRHPEIMAEREKAYQEHKEKLRSGEFDYSFWKKGMWYQDKKSHEAPYEFFLSKPTVEGDKPLSKNWEYYKQVAQNPEFDKEQGKKSTFKIV
uniref:NADH dehydrogenase [ubiquinone] 1 beta subcomplex subunit 10 n=1 Tax=Panagrolaimus davidi TaxID=227884 RepID=A0A914QHJ8_9BILA